MRVIEKYNHEYGVKTKSKKKPRIIFGIICSLVVVSIATLLFAPNANRSTPAVLQQNTSEELSGSAELNEKVEKQYDFSPIELPRVGQTAFKVRGGRTWSSGTNNQAPMASITKVVTALAVLEKAPLELGQQGDTITFNTNDEQYYTDYLAVQGTVTGVTSGQSMTQYEALQAILLASSNNIADTLADRYFGNQQDFVIYANSMLVRLGLDDTKVADASGFNPASVSTPLDLLKLGELALDNPVIAEIVAQEEAAIMDGIRIPNYNALIGFDEVNGIKPGFTDEAGYCLLFSAEFPNADGEKEQFIAVVSGIHDRAAYFDALTTVYENAKQVISSHDGTLAEN